MHFVHLKSNPAEDTLKRSKRMLSDYLKVILLFCFMEYNEVAMCPKHVLAEYF